MQQVYYNVSKVMIENRNNSNLLYLPLDKLMQQGAAVAPAAAPLAPAAAETTNPAGTVDVRSRDGQRGRDRDGR